MRARTLALGGWLVRRLGSSGGVAPCRRSPTRRPPTATASDARDDQTGKQRKEFGHLVTLACRL
eukprot:2442873-Prymnesium_polylepis.1